MPATRAAVRTAKSLGSGASGGSRSARVAGTHAVSERVDVWLGRALLALLLLAGVAAVLVYSGDSLRDFSLSMPERAALRIQTLASWGMAIAACVALSAGFTLAGKR